MTIGIIGAGSIGAVFARKLAHASIPAILSNSHGPGSLADLVADIGGCCPSGDAERSGRAGLGARR
jgi:predicted dinucleotide-binding enzyme